MKLINRLLLAILLLTVFVILFRGPVYRSLVKYHSIGERGNYSVTNAKLTHYLDSAPGIKDPDIHQVIKSALSLTSRQLNFTAHKNDNDPNMLIISKTAHCIGYAHFFATTCNYFLGTHNLSGVGLPNLRLVSYIFLG